MKSRPSPTTSCARGARRPWNTGRPPFPRAVFFGTSAFAVPSLRALVERAEVTLVVTQPDRPRGRGQRTQPSPVKAAALELGVPTLEPARLREALPRLREEHGDVFVVAAYGKIVPQALLDLAPLGALNVHPSLLPLYRGATPLQSAIRDGRRESGVTIIRMDAGMDTGDIVLQERTAIGARETYGELHDRYAKLGAALLVQAVERAAAGPLQTVRQADMGVPADEVAATLTRPLRAEDLRIDWSLPARKVVDFIRSLAPAPLARAEIGGETIKVVSAHALTADDRDADAILSCGDNGSVVLERVVPPNRKPMTGREYFTARDLWPRCAEW